ncbi:MAG: hypothetical protein ACOC5E_00170 [Acidobacteriota bacterium]
MNTLSTEHVETPVENRWRSGATGHGAAALTFCTVHGASGAPVQVAQVID